MYKRLDQKLTAIHADPQGCREFIIADAKDADMGFGIGAPGVSPERHDGETRFKTLAQYREQIRQVIRQGVVDIVLMSASTSEVLTMRERLFDESPLTPAVRANDATDIFVFRGSTIPQSPARPFRSATIDHAQCGHLDCEPAERSRGANLGLYSVTFNNEIHVDLETLTAFKEFREEAERKGFRYFLEVFNPNLPGAVPAELIPRYINDVIARTLAGVTSSGRPDFLKIPYPGPKAMEELVAFDPHLVVGILGGSSGTTRDAFQLIHDAQKYGGRVALFGRKINFAENQLAFIEFLRLIVEGELQPQEAVQAYHAVLDKLGVKPLRPLAQDQEITEQSMRYASSAVTVPAGMPTTPGKKAPVSRQDKAGAPDFSKMNSAERLDYHRRRLAEELGS